MRHVLQNSKIAFFAGLLFIVICASAWQVSTDSAQTKNDSEQASADTARPGSVCIDKIDLGVNIDSIIERTQISINSVNLNKIQQQVNASLAAINFDEINNNIENAVKSINWDKMKIDMSKAMDEAKAELSKVNTAEIKASLKKVETELNSEQFKKSIDLSNLQKELGESMANAKKEIAKAKTEIANYRSFVAALQNDGLLKAGEPYKIELKDNILYINSVKQTKETTEKYRKYYQGKTHFFIYDNKNNSGEEEAEGTDL